MAGLRLASLWHPLVSDVQAGGHRRASPAWTRNARRLRSLFSGEWNGSVRQFASLAARCEARPALELCRSARSSCRILFPWRERVGGGSGQGACGVCAKVLRRQLKTRWAPGELMGALAGRLDGDKRRGAFSRR
jgi:hypothetical protein